MINHSSQLSSVIKFSIIVLLQVNFTVCQNASDLVGKTSQACELSPIYETRAMFVPDSKLNRSNITDGQEGIPFHLIVRLINSQTCSPLQGAYVHIWHANGIGHYSSTNSITFFDLFTGDGRIRRLSSHFLRGHQITDHKGDASFITIIPGWIPSRTIHIHVQVSLDSTDSIIYVGQLFLNENLPDQLNLLNVLASVHPYKTNRALRLTNKRDSIYAYHSGSKTEMNLAKIGSGYQSIVTIGVDSTRILKPN